MEIKKIWNVGHGRFEYRNTNGDLHRDDGPAIILPHGHEEWFINGLRHRIGGPAVKIPHWVYDTGIASKKILVYERKYYALGKLHRPDGPAIEFANKVEWWLEGRRYTEPKFFEIQKDTEHVGALFARVYGAK